MSSSNLFWRSVEAIDWGARDAALREHLGDTYAQIVPYLVPSPTLTYQMACDRSRDGHVCRYRIVEDPEPDGTHAAVCDEGRCPTTFFTRQALVRYTINRQRMGHAVAACLGLHPQVEERQHGAVNLGQVAGSERSIPVLFVRQKNESRIKAVVQHLYLEGKCKFILVAPSGRYLGESVQQLLARFDCRSLPLDEVTEIVGHKPVLTAMGKVRWQKLKESIGGASVLGVTFPTPPNAHWHDLSLVFRDGHTVVVSLGEYRGTYTYKDMGMSRKNQQPNVQWKLLYQIDEEMGMFTWTSRHANANNKKRKQRLSASLKAFFGIEGDPFQYRKSSGGWETVFTIRTNH